MPIWKLEPADPTVDHWRCSTWLAAVFIRANDELAARGMAQSAFGIVPGKPLGPVVPLMPWVHEWIATCEQVEDSEYKVDGPDEILGPEEALKRAYPPPR